MKIRSALLAFAVTGILASAQSLAQNAYITNNQSNYMSVINTVTNSRLLANKIAKQQAV